MIHATHQARSPGPRRLLPVLLLALAGACKLPPTGSEAPQGTSPSDEHATWAAATEGCESLSGLLTVYLDRAAGRVLLELPAPDERGRCAELLWLEGLRAGLGSNPVGLDRGQWSEARLVRFRRLGERVLLVQPNLRHGQASGSSDERRAAAESFAPAVLWAGELLAEQDDGRSLIDFTDFVVADAHHAAATLKASGQGSYQLDAARSLLDADATLALPDNLEFEALLTFASDEPGPLVRAAAADPRSLTLVQHHSLVRLPDNDYQVLESDPRAGCFSLRRRDVSAPLDQPVEQLLATRHRMTDARGNPRPLVYYVDRGVPEPVRSALLTGAGWWSQAFAAAGFPDGFRVELLPEGSHPLDVRYNVIEWVHRTTRGWSYGHSITDPRTGEIIKGHVSLGSLRVRQDQLLLQGLLGAGQLGSGLPDDPIQLSLARIRQLAAHEVGHTLGLAHHFGASALPNGSVMDYPAPHLRVGADGELDTSAVYGVGVGPWDMLAIRWLYGKFAPGAAGRAERGALLVQARRRVPPFLSDADARSPSAANPASSLWDNGADPVDALRDAMAVRELGLARFGADRVLPGRPMADLAEVFAPLWLYHRYQLAATLKLLGGVEYSHALVGDGAPGPRFTEAASQRRALAAVLELIDPARLDVPDNALAVLSPPTPDGSGSAELLPGREGPVFDPLEAAAVAAELVISGLLQPARCERLVDQHRRQAELPGLDDVLAALLTATLTPDPLPPRTAAVADRTEAVLVDALIGLADDERASAPVRARVRAALTILAGRLEQVRDPDRRPQRQALSHQIQLALERPAPPREPTNPTAPPPPGSPIGWSPSAPCAWGEPASP